MEMSLKKSLFIASIALASGCSSTPMPEMFINHFNETSSNPKHAECMSNNAMFNNRQLMVSPSAVENTWKYCLNQFGIIAPGEEESEQIEPAWGEN